MVYKSNRSASQFQGESVCGAAKLIKFTEYSLKTIKKLNLSFGTFLRILPCVHIGFERAEKVKLYLFLEQSASVPTSSNTAIFLNDPG